MADFVEAVRLRRTVGSTQPSYQYERDVELTEAGIEQVERVLACGNLHAESNVTLLAQVNCALHARTLLHRDVDYIVRSGRIELAKTIVEQPIAMRVIVNRCGGCAWSPSGSGHPAAGLVACDGARLGVYTGHHGYVEILELQPAGKKRMTAEEFLRGYPLGDGDRFGPEVVS